MLADNSLNNELYSVLDFKLKFSMIDFNIEAVLSQKHKCIIKENFTILLLTENGELEKESYIVKSARDKILNIFTNIEKEDDLFNYFSFMSSDIVEIKEKLYFMLNDQKNFEYTKNLIFNSIFDNYILYEYEVFDNPNQGITYTPEEKEKILDEMNNRLSFVNNRFLYKICCLNKCTMNKNIQNALKVEKYFLNILHEIMHFITFENNKESSIKLIKTPIIKEIIKLSSNPAYNSHSLDGGELLEHMIAVI